ncbi:MAG: hypothetical protein JWM59_2453 [Verrucomicrobiales bacterium]|nr:hypothetical protein [Verrucomicrobiales bacterium]
MFTTEDKTQHTPGPWSYRPHSLDDWGVVRDKAGNIVACARAGRLVPHLEMDRCRQDKTDPFCGNGRLIAAAPELLEEMREILALAEERDWNPEGFQDLVASRARAAIAKAEGRAE